MFKYILLCTLLAHTMWAKPVHQHAELAPHVLIVTPQAQLRLESLIPGTPIIQHLSPFTRFIAPHEETIVYVPASAAAAASIQPLQFTEVVARSLPSSGTRQDYNQIASSAQEAILAGGSQLQEAFQSGFQNAGTLIAGSTSSFAPAGVDYNPVVQGLTSAASAAAAAGSSLAGAASFAPGGFDYSPVVQGLSSAASAASAAAQSAGSSLAGASSFAPSDPNALVQGFLEQGPNVLSSATNAATAAAASAGSSFVSGFTPAGSLSSSPSSGSQQSSLSSSASLDPSPIPAPSLSSPPSPGMSSDKLALSSNKLASSLPKIEKIEYEIPITPILSNEPRHHYVIAPAVPHIVDFVQGPILLAPSISTIKARSLQEIRDKEKPVITIPLPELPKPEALPLTNDLDKGELHKDIDDNEKKSEFKRFLEANALKEDLKQDALNLKNQIKPAEEQKIEKINLEKTKLELNSAPIVNDKDDEKPQSKVA